MANTRRGHRRPRTASRLTAMGAGAAVALGGTMAALPASAADDPDIPDPWVTTTPEGYHRITVPQAAVEEIVGGRPQIVELQGNIGPAGAWSDLALDPSGSDYAAMVGPLEPGLYYYTYTATFPDRRKVSFKEPTSPQAVTSHPEWNTFFVPGPSVQWMSDLPAGGEVAELGYESPVTGEERTALVWTPPRYDAGRADAYPVLYLLADGDQSAQEWAELGRVPQVLDNLAAQGELEPMVVVMADVNGSDPRTELLDGVVEATREAYHVAGDGSDQALAGIGDGATQALETLRAAPGTFGSVGSFSGRLPGSISPRQAEAIAAGTDLVRVYVGNVLDPAYNSTHALLGKLAAAGVEHQFDGVDPDTGGTWDTWREAVRDFASRVFRDGADPGPREGHRPLDRPYTPPAPGSITTPHVDEHGIATFETGTQWADAKDVTVWANWAPNGAWFRIPMTKVGDRWRLSVGPLDGFYYYRYVVDGVDEKDPADTVNTLTGVSPLFVPGQTDRLLGDAPEGKRGDLSVLTYDSAVAGEERQAYVWTPPDYDPARAEPYPVFYLNHGGGQSWGDWVEVGRAPQILDNLYLDGAIVPMVVVMPNGNVPDFQAELFDNLVPAVSARYHVSDDPADRAIAGLSMGAMNTLNTWLGHPGEFEWIGSFSGFVFVTPEFDAAEVNAGTRLARIYTGDVSDFTHDFTMGLMEMLDERGVAYEFPGVTVGPHGFDTWQQNLVDFLPRIFRPDTEAGIPVTAVVPEKEHGVLALTVADFGEGVTLSEARNVGDRLRATGELPEVTVTDSRPVEQAGASGWAVSGQAYTFTSTARTVEAGHLGWTPKVLTPRAGLAAGEARSTVLSGGEGLATPARLASADVTGRFGTARLGAGLTFDVPVDTQPGSYRGTVTLSLFPVD